jgi:hypothetical protein
MGGALSKPDPAATLQVVGAGYSRTGTSSLQLALAKLVDGPVYHGGTQIWMSGDDGTSHFCFVLGTSIERKSTRKNIWAGNKKKQSGTIIYCYYY